MNREDFVFTKESVVFRLQEHRKAPAIRELLAGVRVFDDLCSREALFRAVMEREKETGTAFGHGVAVTHGKLREVGTVRAALGVSAGGIDFGAPDGQLVHFLFLVASPVDHPWEYLSFLSAVARTVQNEAFRDQLMSCSCRKELIRRLNGVYAREKERITGVTASAVV